MSKLTERLLDIAEHVEYAYLDGMTAENCEQFAAEIRGAEAALEQAEEALKLVFQGWCIERGGGSPRCDMLKPQSEYTPRWGKRNGNTYYRSNVCKPCEATRRREWAHAHPEREREHRRRYREKLRARRAA